MTKFLQGSFINWLESSLGVVRVILMRKFKGNVRRSCILQHFRTNFTFDSEMLPTFIPALAKSTLGLSLAIIPSALINEADLFILFWRNDHSAIFVCCW